MNRKIHVTIFCDEVKKRPIKNSKNETLEVWDYIGVLIVPTNNIKPLAYELNSMRCPNANYNVCNNNCSFHIKNKIKIHYQKYSDTNNYQIANRWCDVLLNNKFFNKRFYIHVLGINLKKIDKSYFKSSDDNANVDNNIYNRFFRTALKFPLKSNFSEYDEIIVDNIYHDFGNMEYHTYFKRQPIRKLNEEVSNANFICKEIKNLQYSNDNCMDENAVMLQFIDLFLGGTLNCLHAEAKKNKEKIAIKLLPIIERAILEPYNKNGSYYKVYSISFFPRNSINKDDDWIYQYMIRNDNFYYNREIKINKIDQLSLF